MKSVALGIAAVLACSIPSLAHAGASEAELAGRYRAAMRSARWTGPLLASNAETLPHGHFYTEPYFFDVISGDDHNPGTSGFYQYGLRDNWTIGAAVLLVGNA